MTSLKKWASDRLKKAEESGMFSGLFTDNPQGPGFVMEDYTREQALASIGPGWAKLVGALWDFCKVLDPPVMISQVKEKYGGLRFYVYGGGMQRADMVSVIIHAVEHLSEHTCETCGQHGKRRGREWVYTACDVHTNLEDQEPRKTVGMDDALGGGG